MNKTREFELSEAYQNGFKDGLKAVENGVAKVEEFNKHMETDPVWKFAVAFGEFMQDMQLRS